jgi:hypothetical protein
MAREVIVEWAKYERSAWLPKGFLWNDHAVAARILVLAWFWTEYRQRADFDTQEAASILRFVMRSGQLLAKPSHYTFSTNHGFMQNLALWHISLAFPTIPGAAHFKNIATERFARQMTYYINEEGIILEHSAGYHKHGLQLIGMALKYLDMLDMAVSPVWLTKYEGAKDFYTQLRRPDGSLPLFGDTDMGKKFKDPLIAEIGPGMAVTQLRRRADWGTPRLRAMYPVGGYTVWWDGLRYWPDATYMAQAVVVWSNFPGHGHKLADEMSILFWAAGQTWWTNVGNWPYGVPGRSQAMSWGGSNAPHFIGEPEKSERTTTVRLVGWNDNLTAIDLERNGPRGYQVRRQFFDIEGRLWIVIDSNHNPTRRPTRTVWRTHPDVSVLREKTQGMYRLISAWTKTAVNASFFGSDPISIEEYRGSNEPFTWTVVDGVPSPTSALVVEQPSSTSWLAVVWGLESADSSWRLTRAPTMGRWVDSADWLMIVPTSKGVLHVERKATHIRVFSVGGPSTSLDLIKPGSSVDTFDAKMELQRAYAATAATYPRYRDLITYRVKVTKILVGLMLLQELFFFACRRLAVPYYGALRLMSVFGWVSVGIWLAFVYFNV